LRKALFQGIKIYLTQVKAIRLAWVMNDVAFSRNGGVEDVTVQLVKT